MIDACVTQELLLWAQWAGVRWLRVDVMHDASRAVMSLARVVFPAYFCKPHVREMRPTKLLNCFDAMDTVG